ncbi:uncharacterized protein GLRG_01555, partial [Colletotrichum graminicola M1.001]
SRLLMVLGLAGFVAAFPRIQARSDKCPQTICIDGINTQCSTRWGGCYDRCKPDTRPTMPPCNPTPGPPSITKPPSTPTAKPTPGDSCSTRTICRDFIDDCGHMYGG